MPNVFYAVEYKNYFTSLFFSYFELHKLLGVVTFFLANAIIFSILFYSFKTGKWPVQIIAVHKSSRNIWTCFNWAVNIITQFSVDKTIYQYYFHSHKEIKQNKGGIK